MKNVIGIRKETKDRTQRRAPLAPREVRSLVQQGIGVLVEPWDRRVFTDEQYRRAGATVTEDLSRANVVFGVKEIAPARMLPGMAYVFFSHVIKGQQYNMPMLRHALATEVSLFDYELVKDENGRRALAFGAFAGYAGLIDSFWALGKRLASEGIPSPFERMRYATGYRRLEEARRDLRAMAAEIRARGLDPRLAPFVVLLTGYGRVSTAALELLRLLPVQELEPGELPGLVTSEDHSRKTIYVVQCRKPDLYTRRDRPGTFDLQEFNTRPERYRSTFGAYVPHASLILNGIYWEPRYPKILTKKDVARVFAGRRRPRLRVVGDITCDIEGSVEITVRATTETDPVFVYDPQTGSAVSGWKGRGPVVLAVDKLPTELAWESSSAFSEALAPHVPALARADLERPFRELAIPRPFKNALIAHRGALTPGFRYLSAPLEESA